MKKIKIYLAYKMYVIMKKGSIRIIRSMKPGTEQLEWMDKLVSTNERLASRNDIPAWFRKEIISMNAELLAISLNGVKYWGDLIQLKKGES